MVDDQNQYKKRLANIISVLLLLLLAGSLFYHKVEGWAYLDSLYFATATITTVGYGDFVPKTNLSKMFTIPYMLAGVGIGLYALSVLASHFIERRQKTWLEKMMDFEILSKSQAFIDKFRNIFKSDSFLHYDTKKLVKEAHKKLNIKK